MWSNKEEAACAKSQGQTHLNANSNNRSARRMCGLTTTYKWNHLPLYSWSSWIVYRNALALCSELANCLDELTVQLPNIKKWYSCKRYTKTQLNNYYYRLCKRSMRGETWNTSTVAVLSLLHPTCLLIDSIRKNIAFIDKWFFNPGTTQQLAG